MSGIQSKKDKDTPIPISNVSGDTILYCNLCNTRLVHFGDGVMTCPKDGTKYKPEMDNVRHGSMIETLDGMVSTKEGQVDNTARVAYSPEPSIVRDKPTPKGGFAALAEKGTIRITRYTESDSK